MTEMQDASTDIIVVSNELLCKEEMAKDFNKNFNRGCNIIEVTSLQPISIMQRIVYALLEKNSFIARDADHIVFTLLSEYSRGAATIVHMLTSLMQKSEDNSRIGFELAKQQLKHHIAHLKLEKDLARQNIGIYDSVVDMAQSEPPVTHERDEVSTSSQGPGEIFISEAILSCANDDMKEEPDVSQSESYVSQPNDPDIGFIGIDVQCKVNIMPHIEDVPHSDCDPYNDDNHHKEGLIIGSVHNEVTSSTDIHVSRHTKGKPSEITEVHAKYINDKPSTIINTIMDSVAGNDNKQNASPNATWLPTAVKPSKEHLVPAPKHPLYMYVNDILTYNISLPASSSPVKLSCHNWAYSFTIDLC